MVSSALNYGRWSKSDNSGSVSRSLQRRRAFITRGSDLEPYEDSTAQHRAGDETPHIGPCAAPDSRRGNRALSEKLIRASAMRFRAVPRSRPNRWLSGSGGAKGI